MKYSKGKMLVSLLQPDRLFPVQYLETIRSKIYVDPEKMLMLAMLEDVIACFQKYISSRDGKGKRLFCEAEEWILKEQNGDWFLSFGNICKTLDLNHEYIRQRLKRWRYYGLKENDRIRL